LIGWRITCWTCSMTWSRTITWTLMTSYCVRVEWARTPNSRSSLIIARTHSSSLICWWINWTVNIILAWWLGNIVVWMIDGRLMKIIDWWLSCSIVNRRLPIWTHIGRSSSICWWTKDIWTRRESSLVVRSVHHRVFRHSSIIRGRCVALIGSVNYIPFSIIIFIVHMYRSIASLM
jgi:hypothetical protein